MKILFAADAPKSIGPYSHAIRTGNLLYCSGQTPLDPATMKVAELDIEGQTKRVLDNLKLVLAAAGLTFASVVKTNVFLADMELFPKMNIVYAAYFVEHNPARSTVAVKGLPFQALIEIECIAEFNEANDSL
ncbi:2-iminobutanoate/2-iminopropanoate deaminase [Mucilaginibacter mallensis]|uniref:2-iminobutanoate/2-iminopropanoate deaminase n=1 Tax=Mucilaginibacter mallensis TaxID=652787 RepID=A0A1H1W3X5_MUCMA|nr:Rid family detoxifying hydrolase [Mucilaginibacter mallensis]SDS91206.1 2-iminobutanoate/2-iminopropanoate deaminase [Mucilaginibacter mallensis]